MPPVPGYAPPPGPKITGDPTPSPPPTSSGLATAALVLGLVGFLFSLLTALPGLILGIIASRQIKRSGGQLTGKGLATAGIVLSCVTMVVSVPTLAAMMFPVFGRARTKARETHCMNNQRQIAMAVIMHAQNNDEELPMANGVWQALGLDAGLLKCPAGKTDRGYGYNANLSGRSIGECYDPSTLLVTADAEKSIIASPADIDMRRHEKRAIASFLDGHVDYVAPGDRVEMTLPPRAW